MEYRDLFSFFTGILGGIFFGGGGVDLCSGSTIFGKIRYDDCSKPTTLFLNAREGLKLQYIVVESLDLLILDLSSGYASARPAFFNPIIQNKTTLYNRYSAQDHYWYGIRWRRDWKSGRQGLTRGMQLRARTGESMQLDEDESI